MQELSCCSLFSFVACYDGSKANKQLFDDLNTKKGIPLRDVSYWNFNSGIPCKKKQTNEPHTTTKKWKKRSANDSNEDFFSFQINPSGSFANTQFTNNGDVQRFQGVEMEEVLFLFFKQHLNFDNVQKTAAQRNINILARLLPSPTTTAAKMGNNRPL